MKYWTENEIKLLKQYYNKISIEDLIKNYLLYYTKKQILSKAYILKITKNRIWTQKEVNILLENKNKPINDYINLLPNRNRKTIEAKRAELGLTNKNRGKELNAKCAYCGKKIHVFPSRLKTKKYHLCNKECFKKWRVEFSKGENNPFYGKTHTQETIQKIIQINSREKPELRKWTDKKLVELKQYLLDGLTYYEIAKIYNIKKENLMPIVRKYGLLDFYIAKYKNNSEGHLKLRELLESMFPKNLFKNEKYIKNIKQFIDISDEILGIFYEYNGIQHYIQKGTWNRDNKDFKKQQERDNRKYNYCLTNNIPLIVIRYDEELNKELIIQKLKEQGINYEDICESQVSSFCL